ncbi:ankyrin repeat-containing protein [Trichoderma evansii]
MDPLSLSTSALAIVTFASQICKSIALLRSLCKSLPGRIHALSNEVADFELVLLQLASLVEGREILPENKYSAIPHLLKQARAKLNEVETIVNTLTRTYQKSRLPLSLMNTWRADQARLKELQDDIRTVKSSLNIMLGATNSEDMLRIRLDIQAISTTTTQASQTQSALGERFITSLAGVDERIARVEQMLQHQADILQMNQFIQVQSAYGTNLTLKKRETMTKPHSAIMPEQLNLGIRRNSASPAFLNNLLGRLFVGYAGMPAMSPKCDNQECQGSRSSKISLEYWFPASVWSRILRMELSFHHAAGPSLQLDMLRIIPDNSQCINFAVDGNISGLKFLFDRGFASPRDVSSTRGYSLLRWALYSKQYETCKFLLQAGADVDYKPIGAFDNSPRIKACHFLLEGNLSEPAVDALRAITKGNEYLEDFIDDSRFTKTHRIVLGLSSSDLEAELLLHPEEIDAQDSMGRTALAWAAARNDSRAVVTLLRYGADPNIIDVQISGALSNAAAQGHTACVKLLLDSGADPDPPLPSGIKKGSPLNVAARNSNDALLVKVLLDFGADVNQAGVDGKTALFHAAQKDDASLAILLLEYGAEINMSSSTGDTPLTTAITHNSHHVLQLFLERWHEYSECPRLKGPHLLNITALYANLKTIYILANTDHFRLKYDENYALGDFRKTLHDRKDATDKLNFAFDELLQIFEGASHMTESDGSLLEAGQMHCTSPVSPTSWEKGYLGQQHRDNEDSDDDFHDAYEQL